MEEKFLTLTDLFTVSYLKAVNFEESEKPKFQRNLIIYRFEKTPELEKALQDLVNRTALIEPLLILETYRGIKSLAWELRKGAK